MASEVVKTIRSSGGDYTSLSAWEAGEQKDLVTADEIAVAECYNDWPSGLADNVVVSGWTTDSTRYVRIYAPQAERHTGVLKSGSDYTGFTLKRTGTKDPISTSQAYTQVIGIAVDVNTAAYNGIYMDADGCLTDSCIVANINSRYRTGIQLKGYNNQKVVNCIVFNCEVGIDAQLAGSGVNKSGRIVYNCTAIDCPNTGIKWGQISGAHLTNAYMKNCLADTGATDFNLSPVDSGGVSYCASSDATADDQGGTGNRINQTFTFADYANDDFRLTNADAGGKDYGTDLSADPQYAFNTDITGYTRSGTWDIGAFLVLGKVSYYWVGNFDLWSDSAYWSTSSGGAGGAGVPDETVNAILDSNSGRCQVTSGAKCFGLDTSAFSGLLSGQDLTCCGDVTLGSGTEVQNNLILDGAGNQTFTQDSAEMKSNTLTIGVANSPNVTLGGALTEVNYYLLSVVLDSGSLNCGSYTHYIQSLTGSGGTLNLNTCNLKIRTTLTLTSITVPAASGATVTGRGVGTATLNFGANTVGCALIVDGDNGGAATEVSGTDAEFSYITVIEGIFDNNLTGTLTVTGLFSVSSGATTSVYAGSGTIECQGGLGLKNVNTFNKESSTIKMNGTSSQTLSLWGNTLNNLQISNTSAAVTISSGSGAGGTIDGTLTFDAATHTKFTAGETFTHNGTLVCNGSAGNLITLESDSAGTQFVLGTSAAAITYTNVKDCESSAGITATDNCTDNGNNKNFRWETALYQVGAATAAASNYSLFSGGTGGAGTPGVADMLVCDNNTPATVTSDGAVSVDTLYMKAVFSGTYDMSSSNLTAATLVDIDGGTLDLGNATLTLNTATLDKAAGGTVTFDTAGKISCSGACVLTGTFTVSGELELDGSALTVTNTVTVTGVLTLKGNETITGTLTIDDTSSTVTFYDSAVTAVVTDYALSFYTLRFGASKTHTFDNTKTVVVKGALSSDGSKTTQSILRSDSPGTKWELNLQGVSNLSDKVDVQDSDALAGVEVSASGSKDSGNNDNWDFGDGHVPKWARTEFLWSWGWIGKSGS